MVAICGAHVLKHSSATEHPGWRESECYTLAKGGSTGVSLCKDLGVELDFAVEGDSCGYKKE